MMMLRNRRGSVAAAATRTWQLNCDGNLKAFKGIKVSLAQNTIIPMGTLLQMRSHSNETQKKTFNEEPLPYGAKRSGQKKRSAGFPDLIEKWGTQPFYAFGVAGFGITAADLYVNGLLSSLWFGVPLAIYWAIGLKDIRQEQHAVLRNFPFLGNIRYILESLRPEIRQYFIEHENEATPFDRGLRSMAYQRAKDLPDQVPFGTQKDVYAVGYEWINHSTFPKHVAEENMRVLIGKNTSKYPYSASMLNVSGMSYGALSDNAVLALNAGAKMGGFYQNTGEGGISKFHKEPGGDIVWNIGTGYFGCRTKDGKFCPVMFQKNASLEQVKMIEIKLSQGAKPAHGGILPKAKVTKFIAEARGVEVGQDCLSPPNHSAFSNPYELIEFAQRLREISGKPVGIKLCVGQPQDLAAIVRAMVRLDVYLDFITIDGAEGGTGAAPPEFSNNVGMPLNEGLTLCNNLLIGAGIRENVTIICSGKVLSGFSIVKNIALGADVCNAARAMMFAIGCIQSLKCNTNKCPTGVATQNPKLMNALVVPDKAERVYNFHKRTLFTAGEIFGAAGLDDPRMITPEMIMKRVEGERVVSYAELYQRVKPRCLRDGIGPLYLQKHWKEAARILDSSRVARIL